MARMMLDVKGPVPEDMTVTKEEYEAECAVIRAGLVGGNIPGAEVHDSSGSGG
jgi:hypothetical protein